MQDNDDELEKENRKRLGLDEDLRYTRDSKFADTFGSTYPPLGQSSKDFVSTHVTHPDTGRIGYERTTRYGSGDRDEVKRPRPAYSGNQAHDLFAGAPDGEFVRNMRERAVPYGASGIVANAGYASEGEVPALDDLTIDYRQLSHEWHNRDRR
jgi:hypothetical protein